MARSSSSSETANLGGSTPSTLKSRRLPPFTSSPSARAGRTAPHAPQKKRSDEVVATPQDQHAPREEGDTSAENDREDASESRQVPRPGRGRRASMSMPRGARVVAAAAARCSGRWRHRGPADRCAAARSTSPTARRDRHIPRVRAVSDEGGGPRCQSFVRVSSRAFSPSLRVKG